MTDNVLKVKNLTKKFRIYHEKRNSTFEIIESFFKKNKFYEEITVLDNISFEVKKGEMFGIIGKNGTGKTTLLRILSKIYQQDKGTIEISGKVVPFLGLGAAFNEEITANENVILYGKLLGFSNKEIRSRLEKIIQFAELEKFADTKLKNFSSGMYARLAFATAIQVDPDIILMDEILSVGDIGFQRKSYNAFMEFKEKNKSIILVSHDLNVIKTNCDRAMFLDDGKIKAIGNINDVINEYKSYFSEKLN
jgi:ABC-type polysaccharide/polyol phosphate transport system ATPase subunit